MKNLRESKLSEVEFIMLINVKMPTIVGILTSMSMINFILRWVEHEKCLITSMSGQMPEIRLKQNIRQRYK